MNISFVFRQMLDALPLHAEEGNVREEIAETDLVSNNSIGTHSFVEVAAAVAVIRRIFESMSLLDPTILHQGRWAFVSFPASLVARSFLETLATVGTSFFPSDYWQQGHHRPDETLEEQRELLTRLENQRISNVSIEPNPIRTVHVTWGIIRFGQNFLFHKREDVHRRNVKGYVFPGGRLALTDLPSEDQSSRSLKDLFCIESKLAKGAQQKTLDRELHEELGCSISEYSARYERTLPPFKKIEGTRNNISLTQYNIAIYSVQLHKEGELKLLDRMEKYPSQWKFFSLAELLDRRPVEGRQAFIDALFCMPKNEIEHFLIHGIPDSDSPNIYATKAESIALPASFKMSFLKGDAGRQNHIKVELNLKTWELLMILGWAKRDLKFDIKQELFVVLGSGWVKLCNEELQETAVALINQLKKSDLYLVEYNSHGYCRLSINVNYLYFQPECFSYMWDIESDNKPILLKLKKIETTYCNLLEKELSIALTPTLLKAMPALEAGREPDGDLETIRREFRRKFEDAGDIGLHQFIAKRNLADEIVVPLYK